MMIILKSHHLPTALRSYGAASMLALTMTLNTSTPQAIAQIAPARLAPARLERTESEIDAAALVLGEPAYGPTHYGQNINGAAFQDAVTSFAGWQYVVYYHGARQLCLSRRRLPDGAWQTMRFSGYEFKTNDAHNVASVGISPRDGTIHLAYDGHGVAPTWFRASRAGIATKPEAVAWDETLFGPQTGGVEAGKHLKSITYPRYFCAPDGALQLSYRTGGSGTGELWFVDYNAQTGQWENSRQIDTREGSWTDVPGSALSLTRSSYANGFDYAPDGSLHTTWTWRENNPVGNRDIAYAASSDRGFTWKNNAGQVIAHAKPGSVADVMGMNSPGIVVVPISRRDGMINTQAQAIDSRGRVHLVISHVTPQSVRAAGFKYPGAATWGAPAALRYHHYMRQSDGKWAHLELPGVAGGRGWLGFDARDTAYFVHLDRPTPVSTLDKDEIYFTASMSVHVATAKANYRDWHVAYREAGPFLSEFRPDTARLKSEGVLSIYAQRAAAKGVFSSALSVIDLKIKP